MQRCGVVLAFTDAVHMEVDQQAQTNEKPRIKEFASTA
jgi:hypothetical protein